MTNSKGKQYINDDDLFDFVTNDLGLKRDDPLFDQIATNIMRINKI